MRLVDELIHRLTRSTIDQLIEQQLAARGDFLAMRFDENATYWCLAIRRFRIAAFPALLAVADLDLIGEKIGLLAPEQARLWIGVDAQRSDDAMIVDEELQQNWMTGDLGAFVGVVDLRERVPGIVETERDGTELCGVGRTLSILPPIGERVIRQGGASETNILVRRDFADRHADAKVAQIVVSCGQRGAADEEDDKAKRNIETFHANYFSLVVAGPDKAAPFSL